MKKPTKEQLLQDVLSDLTWSEIANKYHYTDSRFLRKLAVQWDLPKRRKILKPTKIQLEKMIVQDKLNAYEVATRLGYAENGWSLIYKYCREYGIPVDNKPYEDIRRTNLSSEQKSIVYGTLLGDSYLRNTYKDSFALIFAHGKKQIDYLEWKKEKLQDFIILSNPTKSETKWEYNHDPVFSYNTISHPFFTELRHSLYPNGTKTVTEDWLTNVDELALAVWYLDDGSQNKRYGTISLATNSFTYEEHLIMQEWFWKSWNIETKIEAAFSKSSGKLQNRLRINPSYAKDFINLISPFVPECMQYKVSYKYL